MRDKRFIIIYLLIFYSVISLANPEEQPEIPPVVLKKLEQLQKGELTQLERIKLADDLQRAGAKAEALSLYEENLPGDKIDNNLPPEAYLNYGTALLEKGEEQRGLDVYDSLAESLNSKDPKAQQIKELIEKNTLNYFQVQEQKKKEEKKENKDNKENKDQKENQQGEGSDQDQKNQQGQDPKKPQDKQGQGDQSKDKKDKKDGKGEEKDKEKKDQDKEKDSEQKDQNDQDNKEQKDKNESGQDGEEKKTPPPKMSPKLKQLMSDDRQLQLKVIEQGTRDMNRRQNRENKDW